MHSIAKHHMPPRRTTNHHAIPLHFLWVTTVLDGVEHFRLIIDACDIEPSAAWQVIIKRSTLADLGRIW